MKINIDFNAFVSAFYKVRKDNFSYEGLKTLYNFWVEEEGESFDGISEEELDVIALCCSFTEYGDFAEIQEDYTVESIEEVRNNTLVLEIRGGGYIVNNY